MNSHVLTRHVTSPEPLESRIAPATFLVTSLLDDLSGGTLREAIDLANADAAKADTVVFAPGLIGTIVIDPAKNGIAIEGPVMIKGPGIDKITVDASGTTRAFFIDDGDAGKLSPVSISGLAILGGLGGTNGGAINCLEPLTLKNVAVIGGEANLKGGGVYVETAGKVSITGVQFLGNAAVAVGMGEGGGLYVEDAASVVISQSVFSGNASEFFGGGARLSTSGPKGSVTVSDTLFLNNSTDPRTGGGLAVFTTTTLVVKNCDFVGNSADYSAGMNFSAVTATLTNCNWLDNTADFDGGALGFNSTGKVTIAKSTFAGNDAGANSGAIEFFGSPQLNIVGSQFRDNTAVGKGGVMAHSGVQPGTISISSSVFSGNSAAEGGAFHLNQPLNPQRMSVFLKGSAFTDNHATGEGGAIYADTGVLAITGGSFIGNSAGGNGGGIFTTGTGAEAASLAVTGTLFQGNSAVGSGGAIAVGSELGAVIKGARFLSNRAIVGDGGAVALDTPGTVDIRGSLFRWNVGDDGGAVDIDNGTVTISGSTFRENAVDLATGLGGAINVLGGTVTLSKLTVFGNVANTGGGICAAPATTTLTGSTVTGNFATTGSNVFGI